MIHVRCCFSGFGRNLLHACCKRELTHRYEAESQALQTRQEKERERQRQRMEARLERRRARAQASRDPAFTRTKQSMRATRCVTRSIIEQHQTCKQAATPTCAHMCNHQEPCKDGTSPVENRACVDWEEAGAPAEHGAGLQAACSDGSSREGLRAHV